MVLGKVSDRHIDWAPSTANASAVGIAVVVSAMLAIVAVGIECANRVCHAYSDCAHTPATLVTLLALSDSMHRAGYANDRVHCDSIACKSHIEC